MNFNDCILICTDFEHLMKYLVFCIFHPDGKTFLVLKINVLKIQKVAFEFFIFWYQFCLDMSTVVDGKKAHGNKSSFNYCIILYLKNISLIITRSQLNG